MTAARRINLVQGEHLATDRPGSVLSTLLGSCIAVCLHDSAAHVGGMNHFLLGRPDAGQTVGVHEMQRYGVHAMELLINALMRKGANRSRLRAQIYGGANIVAGLGSIGSSNAEFARRFMQTEGIRIGHCDVGGKQARRLEFMPYDGKARCRALAEMPTIVRKPVVMPPPGGGDVDLF